MSAVTRTRTSILVSTSGMCHAPKRNRITGEYARRYGFRLTLCGQIAEAGWSQHLRSGYVDCKTCLRLLEEAA